MENMKPESKGAWVAVWFVAWIVWACLLLSWPLDMAIILMQNQGLQYSGDFKMPFFDPFLTALAIAAVVSVILAFLFRWLFFRFLINEKRFQPGQVGATVWGVIGVLCIYGLIKSIEIYGLAFGFLSSVYFRLYLVFWITSLILMFILMPNLLIKGKVEGGARSDVL